MKKFEYNFPNKFNEIAKLQITQTQSDKEFYLKMSQAEYLTMEPYLKRASEILELGCGLGRFSVYLNSQLEDNPHFVLADFSEVSEEIKYGWNPKDSVYNDLDLTSEFCTLNNLKNFNTLNLSTEKLDKLSDIDLVISVLSVGFHYPIEEYVDILSKIIKKDAIMIFGIRKGMYTEDDFRDRFGKITILENSLVDTKEDLLILEQKI